MSSDRALAECLIALGNLKTSARACVDLTADQPGRDLLHARDLVTGQLTASGRFRAASDTLRLADATRELAQLCAVATLLARECRLETASDDRMSIACRRLTADLYIAHGVLRAMPAPERELGRASSAPPEPDRSTGS